MISRSAVPKFLVILTCLVQAWTGSRGEETEAALKQGEILSRQFCVNCHDYPEPSLLPKRTWLQSVLPAMSVRLGRHYLPQEDEADYRKHTSLDFIPSPYFGTGIARQRILEFGGLPEEPLLSHEDWMKIVTYYGESAPLELGKPPHRDSNEMTLPFAEHPIPVGEGRAERWISLHFSEEHQLLFAGSESDSALVYLQPETFEVLHRSPYPSAPVSIVPSEASPGDASPGDESLYVLTVGSMASTDELKAGVYREDLPSRTTEALFEGLPRSVHLQQVHLGASNPRAFLISGFGNIVGQVFLMLENTPSWIELPVTTRQGSIASYFVDMDGDEEREIVSLISGGAEGVYQYRREDGDLIEKALIRFPSSYGSNAMELVDWDGDGDLDIILTQGDNGDYDPVLKPYHGIRIFENRGADQYEQVFFHPMHGASGLEIADFDLDGDLDIAALSFFPDWKAKTPVDFVYLENRGNGRFAESHLTEGGLARWIVMESGDFDGDGDPDLLLGAHRFDYAVPPDRVQSWEDSPVSLLFLENQTR